MSNKTKRRQVIDRIKSSRNQPNRLQLAEKWLDDNIENVQYREIAIEMLLKLEHLAIDPWWFCVAYVRQTDNYLVRPKGDKIGK